MAEKTEKGGVGSSFRLHLNAFTIIFGMSILFISMYNLYTGYESANVLTDVLGIQQTKFLEPLENALPPQMELRIVCNDTNAMHAMKHFIDYAKLVLQSGQDCCTFGCPSARSCWKVKFVNHAKMHPSDSSDLKGIEYAVVSAYTHRQDKAFSLTNDANGNVVVRVKESFDPDEEDLFGLLYFFHTTIFCNENPTRNSLIDITHINITVYVIYECKRLHRTPRQISLELLREKLNNLGASIDFYTYSFNVEVIGCGEIEEILRKYIKSFNPDNFEYGKFFQIASMWNSPNFVKPFNQNSTENIAIGVYLYDLGIPQSHSLPIKDWGQLILLAKNESQPERYVFTEVCLQFRMWLGLGQHVFSRATEAENWQSLINESSLKFYKQPWPRMGLNSGHLDIDFLPMKRILGSHEYLHLFNDVVVHNFSRLVNTTPMEARGIKKLIKADLTSFMMSQLSAYSIFTKNRMTTHGKAGKSLRLQIFKDLQMRDALMSKIKRVKDFNYHFSLYGPFFIPVSLILAVTTFEYIRFLS